MVIYSCIKLSERKEVIATYFQLLRYQRKKEDELREIVEKTAGYEKGDFTHYLEDYNNIVKAAISEILDYLNRKEWTMAKVQADSHRDQWLTLKT